MTWQAFVAALVVLGIPLLVLNVTNADSPAALFVALAAFFAAWVVYVVINGATAVPKKGPYA